MAMPTRLDDLAMAIFTGALAGIINIAMDGLMPGYHYSWFSVASAWATAYFLGSRDGRRCP